MCRLNWQKSCSMGSRIPPYVPSLQQSKFWYDPDPQCTIIKEDQVFVEAPFAIPDEEMERQLHLQSPWLLCLEMDCAKMIDRKLTMEFVTNRIKKNFKSNSGRYVTFLCQLENMIQC